MLCVPLSVYVSHRTYSVLTHTWELLAAFRLLLLFVTTAISGAPSTGQNTPFITNDLLYDNAMIQNSVLLLLINPNVRKKFKQNCWIFFSNVGLLYPLSWPMTTIFPLSSIGIHVIDCRPFTGFQSCGVMLLGNNIYGPFRECPRIL